MVREVVGFAGELAFDPTKPDGTPRKLLDVSRLTELGWRPRIRLREGLERTYRWFLEHQAHGDECRRRASWQRERAQAVSWKNNDIAGFVSSLRISRRQR